MLERQRPFRLSDGVVEATVLLEAEPFNRELLFEFLVDICMHLPVLTSARPPCGFCPTQRQGVEILSLGHLQLK